MTREEAIEILENTTFIAPLMVDVDTALDMAVSALSENDDVKEPKNGERFSCPNCGFKADWYIPDSAENKGEWIYLDECSNSGYYCSNCHKKLVKDGWSDTVKKIKFCPNCGADMRGE